MRSAGVRGLIAAGRHKLMDQIATVALHQLGETILGKLNPSPSQWAAMKYALDAAEIGTPKSEKDNETRPLRDMTLTEMEALAARMAKARQVQTVPELPSEHVQVIEKTSESTI